MDSASPLGASHRFHPRRFEGFIYAYPVISRRSGGLSIGVNLNLDKLCNFDCPYCQVDRRVAGLPQRIDLAQLQTEVEALLETIDTDGVCQLERFATLPDAEKHLTDIALSGDGEPTMIPEFEAVCTLLAEIQKKFSSLSFKLVLITNSTLLDRKGVKAGIEQLLLQRGEVWAKLDAGTEAYYQRINISRVSLNRIESNLASLGQEHDFRIQSFFCRLVGEDPPEEEIIAYLQRLENLKLRKGFPSKGGAIGSPILEVQLYTLARPPAQSKCSPLPLSWLNALQRRIEALGIPARVYAAAD